MNAVIRVAEKKDTAALRALYGQYIDTDITFELTMPDMETYEKRIEETLKEFPYLVYEAEGRLLGYACAHRVRERDAYQWSAELSVYVDKNTRERGVGARLYEKLTELLKLQNVRNVYGAITGSNVKSLRFHEKQGFRLIATFEKIGFKNGRWMDVLWYEKNIAARDVPQPVIPFGKLDAALIEGVLSASKQRL